MRMPFLSLILLACHAAYGADALTEAREMVNQGRTKDAIVFLNQYVSEAPEDLDARVLLGLICSWDGRWEDGRRAFQAVLASDGNYKDAVLGLINLELWSGHPARAKALAVKAIAARPQDLEYKAALAKVDAALSPARVSAETVRQTPPGSSDEPNWETGVAESTILFSDKRSSWHETAVNFSRRFTAGWVTATVSQVNWFGQNSNLIDLQSYPSLGKGRYAFFDAAFSPDHRLYTHRRFGAELFQSLPKGFEASAGIRYMRFNDNVMLYTASVGKWYGNYWILARTFITPSSTFSTSNSYQLQFRKYYTDADHYIGLRLGEGASPFEVQSINDLGIQHSASAAVESLWKFKNQIRLRASVGVARQTRLYIGPLWQYEADCTLYFRY